MEQKIPCSSRCEGAFYYHAGLKGKNADETKILFVTNKPDSRILKPSLFDDYEIALSKSQTGQIIIDILNDCNLKLSDVFLTNMFKCLLPKDREPTRKEYESCVSLLERQVEGFKPDKMVAFGYRAYEFMFPKLAAQYTFGTMIGHELDYRGVPSLLTYHPGMMWKHPKEKRKEYYKKIKEFLNGI